MADLTLELTLIVVSSYYTNILVMVWFGSCKKAEGLKVLELLRKHTRVGKSTPAPFSNRPS